MKLKELLSRPTVAFSQWCTAHEAFIAVKLTRLLAVVFIVIAFYFLMKSLGLV